MSDLGKRLGRRIYEFRKKSGLTQAGVAERARISNEFMSAVERGAKLPSLEVLERIATSLRVDIKDLFAFDRTADRRIQPLSREVLDVAFEVAQLSEESRRKLLKISRILRDKSD